MPIEIKKRAIVSKNFIENGVKRIAQMKLDYFREQILLQGEGYAKRNKSDIQYCLSLFKSDLPGKGLDLEITNLRALPYITYGLGSLEGFGDYIYAQTGNVVCSDVKVGSYKRWNTGSWMVVVGIDAFMNNSLGKIHVIPSRAPKAMYRHPHHFAYVIGNNYDPINDEELNPLLKTARTCWGQFGSPLGYALIRGSISEVLQIMYRFVSTYTSNDTLVALARLDHFYHMEDRPYEP